MPEPGDVQFTPEGGFRFNGTGPNPFVPPPAVHFYTNMQLSMLSESWGYDQTDEKRSTFLQENTSFRGFTTLDRGSLLRIASCQERSQDVLYEIHAELKRTNEVLLTGLTTLLAALLPAIQVGEAQRESRQKKVWEHFQSLLEKIERTQGECPKDVQEDLWIRFSDQYFVKEFKRGFVCHPVLGITEAPLDFLTIHTDLKLPAKNTKAGKKYRAWAEKNPDPPPEKEEKDAAR